MKGLSGGELSLAGGGISRAPLDVLVCFWLCPHLHSQQSIDCCEGESGTWGKSTSVGKEEAGQVPQARSRQSEMC